MSFSQYKDFFELPSDCSSCASVASNVPSNHSAVLETGHNAENLNGSMMDSESDLSLHETISLDCSTLQDFGSIVSLPVGTLAGLIEMHWRDMERSDEAGEEYSRSTIVSSAPSGAHIPRPEVSENTWAVSPHPHLVSTDLHALSTVCTESLSYQRLRTGDVGSMTSSEHDGDDGSTLVPSSHFIVQQRAAFEAIANRLLRDVGSSGNVEFEVPAGPWFCRFTDTDWEQLREVAKALLDATSPPRNMMLPLPPSPPEHTYEGVGQATNELSSNSFRDQDVVSSSLICPYCNQIIVGALTLDCGCTVCHSCWEESEAFSMDPDNLTDVEAYVWVNGQHCKKCRSIVHSTIPCPALDVAICQVVENLKETEHDTRIQKLKHSYYCRLEAWRATVVTRNELAVEQQAIEEDELLARLIQQEEEWIWNKENQRQKTKKKKNVPDGFWIVLCQAAVAVLAGTISSVAIHTLAKRR